MHKTLYIDVNEEITGILERIRFEEAKDIILVVPKDAMLIQGVINLKLLKKEVEKMDKTLMIATNDKYARKVIERLEIKTQETKNYLTDNKTRSAKEDNISRKASREAADIVNKDKADEDITSFNSVGSAGFYDQTKSGEDIEDMDKVNELPTEIEEQKEDEKDEAEKFDMHGSDKLKKELYMKKEDLQETQQQPARQESAPRLINKSAPAEQQHSQMDVQPKQKKVPVKVKDENPGVRDLFGNVREDDQILSTSKGIVPGNARTSKKAEQFFSKKSENKSKKNIWSAAQEQPKASKFWKVLAAILFLAGAIAGAAAWGYANYPKVYVSIFLQKHTLSKEIKFMVKDGLEPAQISAEAIPGEYLEMIITKSVNFDATGETYESDDGKARGRATIYNKYSSLSQPLVATTRLLSKEGKLFRIVDNVEVPGMSEDEPGKIEVDIIADKHGEDFDISASTFTIEGFKGNPKYEKFEVVSSRSMTGGREPDPSKKRAMVTSGDIDNARKKAVETLEQMLEQEVESQISDGKKVLIDSIEKEIKSASSSHEANDVAESFTYTIDQKIKAIAFSVEDINFIVMQELEKDMDEGFMMDQVSQVTFKKGIADHESKTLTMYVDAQASSWSILDADKIADGIAGKKENEIKAFLSSCPNIEKVEITITPSWLTTIPISKDKIEITEKRL
ncbi:MAG: hypothetical protein U9M90_00925 [Patescibacteria group bacterium]|nr:hypothetical protein [Patescibacteria group bacterium]